MRNIQKGREPHSLAEFRNSGGTDYEEYREKQDLRESLVTEQRGICCYCMQRIHPNQDKMKIEHWHSQKRYPDEQVNYRNLLGSCNGGKGYPPKLQHCDTRKGEADLSRNPANSYHNVEHFIRYLPDGRIESRNTRFDTELNTVLNLNHPLLVANRKKILDAFIQQLPPKGPLLEAALLHWLNDWNGTKNSGQLREYCQVVVYWINKHQTRKKS